MHLLNEKLAPAHVPLVTALRHPHTNVRSACGRKDKPFRSSFRHCSRMSATLTTYPGRLPRENVLSMCSGVCACRRGCGDAIEHSAAHIRYVAATPIPANSSVSNGLINVRPGPIIVSYVIAARIDRISRGPHTRASINTHSRSICRWNARSSSVRFIIIVVRFHPVRVRVWKETFRGAHAEQTHTVGISHTHGRTDAKVINSGVNLESKTGFTCRRRRPVDC